MTRECRQGTDGALTYTGKRAAIVYPLRAPWSNIDCHEAKWNWMESSNDQLLKLLIIITNEIRGGNYSNKIL